MSEELINAPEEMAAPAENAAEVVETAAEVAENAVVAKVDLKGGEQKEILVEKLYTLCEKADLRPDLTAEQRKAFLRRLVGNLSLNEVQLFFAKSLAERISQRVK